MNMGKVIVLSVIGILGLLVWQVVTRLPVEAMGVAVGILLGVMAPIPTLLVSLAAGRQRREDESIVVLRTKRRKTDLLTAGERE